MEKEIGGATRRGVLAGGKRRVSKSGGGSDRGRGIEDKLIRRMDAQMHSASELHEDIAKYEEFKEEILPMLRRDLKKGMQAPEMRKKYLNYLQARQISLGMSAQKEADALAAIKDILDRTEGKAVETKHVTHKYEELADKELDALLISKLKDVTP